MAVSTIPQTALTIDNTMEQAASMLRTGAVTLEAFLEWQVGYEKRKAVASGRVRITVSPKGYVVLNGVTAKGDGFAPNFTARTLADVLDNAPALIAAVVDHVDKAHAADATVKVLNSKWSKDKPDACAKFIDAPHPRAGKPMLKFDGAAELSAVVSRLQAVLAKLAA